MRLNVKAIRNVILIAGMCVLWGAVLFGSVHAAMLRLGGVQFDPLAGQTAAKTSAAVLADKAGVSPSLVPKNNLEAQDRYAIVQFDGPVLPDWRDRLAATGARVLDYVPDYAFIVRFAQERWDELRALPHVRWVGAYAANYRISPEAKALAVFAPTTRMNADTGARVRVTAFPGEDSGMLTSRIMNVGGRVSEVHESSWGIRLSADLPPANVDELATIPGVKWVEIRKTPRISNDKAADIIGIGNYRIGARTDLYGAGQVVAVCDSGLDRGSTTDLHPDFKDGNGASRVREIFRQGDFDSSQDIGGHGTHVAGSILGNGQQSGADPATNYFPDTSFAGMAPRAGLVFQAVGDPFEDTPELPGIPTDLKPLFQEALDASARIHSNSWGESSTGGYNSECADVDQFCWDNKDFLIVFAAGNSGEDYNRDGVIDTYSIDVPAAAKNNLTVGASESLRLTGGYSEDGWGTFVTTTGPLDYDLTSNNTMGMAAFSSRGPCADGRTKPDIVAPGTNILSTRSAVQEGDGWGAYNEWYYYSGGTSMATPVASGTAALLREYLMTEVDDFRITPPSSAMLKACLINAAQNIEPGQYGTGVYREISKTPGPVAGWGRIDLIPAVYPDEPYFIKRYDNSIGLTTGQKKTYTVSAVTDDGPLRVSLAWTDYPSTESANGGLVNDLDLMVRDRNGNIHYPDNAKSKNQMEEVSYYDKAAELQETDDLRIAMRITPTGYPKQLTSLHWGGGNEDYAPGEVEVEIFAADATGHPTGVPLFSETLHTWADGEYALPVGIEVNKGDVVVVFTFEDTTAMGLLATEGNESGRTLIGDGMGGWEKAVFTPAVMAVFFSANASERFDRVNNLVGVTIDKPSGDYTVTVSGYNVPKGPQPFALVVSGTAGEMVEDHFEAVPWQPEAPDLNILSQDFSSMNPAEIRENYRLELTSVHGQVARYTAEFSSGSGLVAMRRAVTFDADHPVSSLTLYKLFTDKTAPEPFTYSEFGEFKDGVWWLSRADGSRLESGDSVEKNVPYFVNSVIQDNGSFDDHEDAGTVSDPQVLGNSGASVVPESSGGGGGGCVMGGPDSRGDVTLWLMVAAALVILIRRHRTA
jgi:subtilisin family serine protease